ncbi:hypothetical protein [Paraburkholderia sp. JHI869]|uniref:hypothetical protein n=1 Tax=Paraburkholderia sp. JHI869 TaxID=3112959 RepID=UPI003174CF44
MKLDRSISKPKHQCEAAMYASGKRSARLRAGGGVDTSEKHSQPTPRFATPQALAHWFEDRIARELERARACMTDAEWTEHCTWIEANARASLLDALRAHADRGAL